MKKYYSLRKRITVVIIVFLVILGAALAFVTFKLNTDAFFRRYQEQMTAILDYVETSIDDDDMSVCAETYQESEKYKETQAFFDHFVDYYSDLHFLYIMKATDPGEEVNIRSVCSANTTYEKENDPDSVVHIGAGEVGWYSDEVAERIREITKGNEDVFFMDPTDWGLDYTLARPLINSAGKHYAVLCVDVSIDNIQSTVYNTIYIYIGILIGLGVLFLIALLLWMRTRVTKPIKELENSVVAFAATSHNQRDPEELEYKAPELKSNNEIKKLSDSVEKMSFDMKSYIKELLAAEKQVEGLNENISRMGEIAFTDALTRVKNKAAYDRAVEVIDAGIENSNAEFAVVMADLNHMKTINDQYGHNNGDKYIVGSCGVICDVFGHSPVYRIGGDEFVVILKDDDYRSRDALIKKLREKFALTSAGQDVDPWERYSASVGMAVFSPGSDSSFAAVFQRADNEMYAEKIASHNKRQ